MIKVKNKSSALIFLCSLFFFTSLNAAETGLGKLLIVGCCPDDDNIQGVEGISDADFLDAHKRGNGGDNFFHCDIDDSNVGGANNFRDFAEEHKEQYQTVVSDRATYHHFHGDYAWQNLLSLLSLGGEIFIPVSRYNFESGDVSRFAAESFIDRKLAELSNDIVIHNIADLRTDGWFSLFHRGHAVGQSAEGVVVVAKKTHKICVHASVNRKKEESIAVLTPGIVHLALQSKESAALPSCEAIKVSLKHNSDRVWNDEGQLYRVFFILLPFIGFESELVEVKLLNAIVNKTNGKLYGRIELTFITGKRLITYIQREA